MEGTPRKVQRTEQPPAYDEQWFGDYKRDAGFESYTYLSGDQGKRNEQKKNFLSGEIGNPTLDYPQLDMEQLHIREQALVDLKRKILEQEEHPIVKQVYRWRLNEKIAELRMLQAAASSDAKKFDRYSQFVYGKPSTEIFQYTVNNLQDNIEAALSSDNEELQKAAGELRAIIPSKQDQDIQGMNLPDEELVSSVQEKTQNDLSDLIQLSSEGDTLNDQDIAAEFQRALKTLKADGWTVIVDPNKTNISADQETKTVRVPQGRTQNREKLQQLIGHEIGTHVARRVNGERSRLRLLGLGLDRYEKAEEGVATFREQALEGKVDDFEGFDGHFAISMAKGLDGKKRDFRETFEIMKAYFVFIQMQKGMDRAAAELDAQTTAWNRCVRTFRGTDCQTPGLVYPKDLIYREGNIGIWDVVSKNISVMETFSLGKFDPANDRHLWVLNQLNIQEEDLDDLENES